MFDQQLTFDGGAEDIAPKMTQPKLFTAPKTIEGQTAMELPGYYGRRSTSWTKFHLCETDGSRAVALCGAEPDAIIWTHRMAPEHIPAIVDTRHLCKRCQRKMQP